MNLLQQALNLLENRLQSLVEGSAARLFPAYDLQSEVTRRLVQAMQLELRPQPDGGWLAPNEYTIYLPGAQLSELSVRELAETLALELQQAAAETGLRFNQDPNIRLLPNPEAGAETVEITAQFSLGPSGNTAVLGPDPLPASVSQPLPNAFLIVDGSRIFLLEKPVINIGRQEDNDLILNDTRISRHHAQLRWVQDRYRLFDLGSSGGTWVNGSAISQWPLSPGDTFLLAGLPVVFGIEQSDPETATQKIPGAIE